MEREDTGGLNALRWTAGVGIAAAVVGALTLAGYASHMSDWDAEVSAGVVASVSANAILVAVEVLLCLAFVAVATMGSATQDRSGAVVYAAVGAIGKPILSGGLIAAHWSPGWYYILDPNGSHALSIWLIVLSAAQAVAFIFAFATLLRKPG